MSKPKGKYSSCRNVKLLVLMALAGTLAASAIIVAFFVLLRPAHISFSITHTRHTKSKLYLTIAANNTSHQRGVAVKYKSFLVTMEDSSDEEKMTHIANLRKPEIFPTEYLRGAEPIRINASLRNHYHKKDIIGDEGSLTVTVQVQASFKIWKARTKLYNIQVSCSKVVFPSSSVIPCAS